MCEAGQQVVYRQDVCSRSAGGVQTGCVYQVDRWCADRMCVAGQQVVYRQDVCMLVSRWCTDRICVVGQLVVYIQDVGNRSPGGVQKVCV